MLAPGTGVQAHERLCKGCSVLGSFMASRAMVRVVRGRAAFSRAAQSLGIPQPSRPGKLRHGEGLGDRQDWAQLKPVHHSRVGRTQGSRRARS